MTARELYQAGQLTAAIDAALAEVKTHPTDTARRGLLCELLCFTGAWERADKQLDTIAHQDPQVAVGLALFRQLLRAEVVRQQCFEEGRVPEFLAEPTPAVRLHLQALAAIRAGQPAEAAQLLDQAEQQRVHVSGYCDTQPFDDFRDLDDLTACFFEALTSNGKYYWIPIDAVETIEFRPPERPRDLLWRRARLCVAGGTEGEVFLPALYPLSFQSSDDQLRLGRGTAWGEEEGAPVRGIGQRMFLVGDSDRSILEMNALRFNLRAEPAGAGPVSTG